MFYDGSCFFEVWPGDTDVNGFVSAFDIIPIGIFWGEIGSPRPGLDFVWESQTGYDNWSNKWAIFADANGKTNLSLSEVSGAALVVSQFTLYADTRKGRRPSFINAATSDIAEPLIEYFAKQLEGYGIPVKLGKFGADMQVTLVNDGPVTIWMEHNSKSESVK